MSTLTLTQTRTAPAAPAPAPIAPPSNGKSSTWVKIDDDWYDLTYWKNSHPGGPLILEQMHGNDATDAFYSLHSDAAAERLKRLPHSKTLPAVLSERPPPPPSKATLAFRQLRQKLIADGWFKRSVFWELFYTFSVYALAVAGTVANWYGYKIAAIILIGLAMQQSGWIGHDWIHSREWILDWNGFLQVGLINAFSRSWWSNKHNTHHVFTNYIGIDADIENDPVFHLFFPEEKDDTFFRKMQHWYFVPVASLLYISWRTQSITHAVTERKYSEMVWWIVNYAWMYHLGIVVALGSIYFGGCLVAVIVTATHQSEEMIDPLAPPKEGSEAPASYSFCEGQFATTRDARTSDFFTEWLWGGMQYQLEHHLFPTMPKYNYRKLAPIVEQFAKENGLSYRVDSQMQIFKRNFQTLKHYANKTEPAKKAQ